MSGEQLDDRAGYLGYLEGPITRVLIGGAD